MDREVYGEDQAGTDQANKASSVPPMELEVEREAMTKYVQHSGEQLFLLLLSLVGVGLSIYLTTVHYENTPLICSTSGLVDCARVLSSAYSVVPGTSVPLSVPSLIWCLGIGALAITRLRVGVAPRWLDAIQFLWTLTGMLIVLYWVQPH